jgi:hypothetical protein
VPMPREKLEDKQRDLSERILEWLTENHDRGFSAIELIAALEDYDNSLAVLLVSLERSTDALGRSRTWQKYLSALEALEARGAVESAEYQGSRYYMARKQHQAG